MLFFSKPSPRYISQFYTLLLLLFLVVIIVFYVKFYYLLLLFAMYLLFIIRSCCYCDAHHCIPCAKTKKSSKNKGLGRYNRWLLRKNMENRYFMCRRLLHPAGSGNTVKCLCQGRSTSPWLEGKGLLARWRGGAVNGFIARDPQALPALPQALAADTQFSGELGFAHGVLVLQYEALEVVFEG